MNLYSKAKRWDMAVEVAEGLTAMLPDVACNWINLAYATRRRRSGGIPNAKGILLVAQVNFPREYLIPFNLACYCAQLHDFDEAAQWLKKAMAPMDDPDLKPPWDGMGGTIWKRE